MKDNKNFFLALALSLLVMVAWNYFYGVPQMDKQKQAQQQSQQQQSQQQPATPAAPGAPAPTPGAQAPATVPGTAAPALGSESRDAVLARTKRVAIDTPSIAGSINLTGARIDDISLKKYRVTVEPKSPNIVLFSPSGAEHAYYAEFGWVPAAGTSTPVPNASTVWTPDGDRLTPEKPLVLTWDNGQGLIFRRTISVDTNAMFTIKDAVENKSGAPVSLLPFSLVSRHGTPETLGFYILHEGAIGFLGDRLQEVGYKEIDKEHQKSWKSTGGFLGITDKYWAAALIPDQNASFDARFSSSNGPLKSYQVDTLLPAQTAAPGQTVDSTTRLFAGAKEVAAIDGYEKSLGIKRFDLLIDWGWFWYFTKPLFWAMDFFFHLFGNFGVAILLVTVLVKLVFFPLANKSYASMARMKAVQPQMLEIRERYKDDKLKQQQETMELYKREKINPIAGCWPMLIQIPVFFALYKVIFITIEMRHAPFFGWIKDLAAPDPTSIFNLFGLIPIELPHFLHVGIWAVIMGITMFVQMKMNPEPTDPVQKTMFSWMPVIFTFMLASFPAGLVIYWSWNNLLSIIQQYVIMRRQGVKVELWDNLRSTFSKKPATTT